MITNGSVYLIVKDYEKTVGFYKRLLECDVSAQNKNRFAIFNINSLCLCIMNGYYDFENPDKVITKGRNYDEYDNYVRIAEAKNTGKIVINLATENLAKEYERIHTLCLGSKLTEIRYINAKNPYYYFTLKDPDDNTIEITGPYDEETEGLE